MNHFEELQKAKAAFSEAWASVHKINADIKEVMKTDKAGIEHRARVLRILRELSAILLINCANSEKAIETTTNLIDGADAAESEQ